RTPARGRHGQVLQVIEIIIRHAVSPCGQQPLSEAFARGVEMPRDGALAAPQNLGSFRVAQVFTVDQKNRVPLLRRQGPDFRPKVLADRLILGRWSPRLEWIVDQGVFDASALWPAKDEDLATPVPQRPTAGAKVVNGNRMNHAIEPSRELGLSAKPADGAGELDADFLGHIFRFLART